MLTENNCHLPGARSRIDDDPLHESPSQELVTFLTHGVALLFRSAIYKYVARSLRLRFSEGHFPECLISGHHLASSHIAFLNTIAIFILHGANWQRMSIADSFAINEKYAA